MLKVAVSYIMIVQCYVQSAQQNGCSITFPKSNDQEEPVLLTANDDGYELAIPEKGKLALAAAEELVLFCPNPRNILSQGNKALVTATCVRNELLKVEHEQYEFTDLTCQKTVKGDLKVTSSNCEDTGRTINIGFEVSKSDWVTLIQVCYDNKQANTLYTRHTIYGQSILQASKQSKRPPFQTNGVPKNLSPNTVFTQANQAQTFAELLGSQKLANQYIHQTSYLARGHLSPDADFLFAPLQFATYFYVNTCPQWSNINSGNWKALESMIRRVAGKRGVPFEVITGTHEILELPDENGNLVEMSLDTRGLLPVPKFIWKVVYSESTKQGIAFVSINNPFVESLSDDLILCQDVCSRYNWVSDKWNVLDKGYIYCCDVKELQKTVRNIPRRSISGILRG